MSREVGKDVGDVGEGKEHDQDYLLHKILLKKRETNKYLQNHFEKENAIFVLKKHTSPFCLQCYSNITGVSYQKFNISLYLFLIKGAALASPDSSF